METVGNGSHAWVPMRWAKCFWRPFLNTDQNLKPPESLTWQFCFQKFELWTRPMEARGYLLLPTCSSLSLELWKRVPAGSVAAPLWGVGRPGSQGGRAVLVRCTLCGHFLGSRMTGLRVSRWGADFHGLLTFTPSMCPSLILKRREGREWVLL